MKKILIAIGMIVLIILFINSKVGEKNYIKVTVCEGDTLWSIAEEYNTEKDIREYIYNIKKINNINNKEVLKEGDILKIYK